MPSGVTRPLSLHTVHLQDSHIRPMETIHAEEFLRHTMRTSLMKGSQDTAGDEVNVLLVRAVS